MAEEERWLPLESNPEVCYYAFHNFCIILLPRWWISSYVNLAFRVCGLSRMCGDLSQTCWPCCQPRSLGSCYSSPSMTTIAMQLRWGITWDECGIVGNINIKDFSSGGHWASCLSKPIVLHEADGEQRLWHGSLASLCGQCAQVFISHESYKTKFFNSFDGFFLRWIR